VPKKVRNDRKMKPAKSPLWLACTKTDPTGIIGASLDARLTLNIIETATVLGVSVTTVRRLLARGLLKPLRHLRHIQIEATQIIQFTGGGGGVIHLPAKTTRTKKQITSPIRQPHACGSPDKDHNLPYLPGFSPEEIMAIQTPSSTMETDQGGCE